MEPINPGEYIIDELAEFTKEQYEYILNHKSRKRMTVLEQYRNEKSWAKRVILMEIYHIAKLHVDKDWTLGKTARDFTCSIGLVSENLKLARAIRDNEKIMNISTREMALRKI